MSELTTDPNDARLGHGSDTVPVPQNKAYLVLSDDEISKGYVRPYFDKYVHSVCNKSTKMSDKIAQTYAANPWFYGSTYCVQCAMHRPLKEFYWPDGISMDPAHWPDSVTDAVAEATKNRNTAKV